MTRCYPEAVSFSSLSRRACCCDTQQIHHVHSNTCVSTKRQLNSHNKSCKGSFCDCQFVPLSPGSGPYKKWESKPLCNQSEEEASTSGEDDDDRDVREGRSRIDSCLQALFWINGGLLLVVIIVGTAVVRGCSLVSLLCPVQAGAALQSQEHVWYWCRGCMAKQQGSSQ